MDWKNKEKWVGTGVFLSALVIYLLTVAPATSFWDSGEFIAIANRLQVPVRFIGIGESAEDMQPFVAREFVDALLAERTS